MTKIVDTRQWSWLLWHLMILLLLIALNNFILTKAAPLPDIFSAENYDEAVKNFLLHRRIEGERRLMEDQLKIHRLLEERAEELYETLPVPSAQQAPDKRQNYMTLCHFKLCNMGRKRPL